MENLKTKKKPNVALIVTMSILILALIIISCILLVQSFKDKQLVLNGDSAKPEGYTEDVKKIIDIPITNIILGGKPSENETNTNNGMIAEFDNNNEIDISPSNNIIHSPGNSITNIPTTSGGSSIIENPDIHSNGMISNYDNTIECPNSNVIYGPLYTYGGEEDNPNSTTSKLPIVSGGEEDEIISSASKTITLNGNKSDVSVERITCILSEDDYFYYIRNSYILTLNNKYKVITSDRDEYVAKEDLNYYLPEDFCNITKIQDKVTNNEYLVLQIFTNYVSGVYSDVYIIDKNLEVLGTIQEPIGTSFTVDGKVQELTINSDSISICNFYNQEQIAQHVYTIENGRLVDTIEKIYHEGEYEVAGRT